MKDVLYSSNLILTSSWWTGSSQVLVKSIIDEYNKVIIEEIENGNTVSYLGLATIEVNKKPTETPLGYHFYEVSKRLGLGYNIVESILLRYCELIKNNLLLENTIVVYGIVKFVVRDFCKVGVKSSSRVTSLGANIRAKLDPYWKREFTRLAQ